MNTEQKLNQFQLNEMKKELMENEKNIKACLWMIEINQIKIKETNWSESEPLAKSQIKFFNERLNKYRKERINLKTNIKKLEVIL